MKTTLLILFVLLLSTFIEAATFTVTNTNDSGAGSLRQAIADANAAAAADTINFNLLANDPNCSAANVCTITLTGGVLTVQSAGGALTINNQTGANRLLISGNNTDRIFEVGQNGILTLDGLTVLRGAGGNTGVIKNSQGTLTITNSVITQNTGGFIIYSGAFGNDGTLSISNTTVSNNTGIGIFATNQLTGGGTVNIISSTVSNNIVSDTALSGGNGGGIYFLGGQLRITNSTVSSNGNAAGGGIFASTFGTSGSTSVVLTNCTVTANTSTEGGGGIEVFRGTLDLRNTIVAGNTAAGSASDIRFNNAGGTSFGNNLIGTSINFGSGNGQWVASDLLNRDARLAPLGNNGGTTQTHALLPDSPAINAGNNCVLTANGCGDNNPAVPVDQRGQARVGTVDIGAYEFQDNCTYSVSPTSVIIPAAGGTATVNVTAPDGCAWTASSNSTNATVSPSSGSGSGVVTITAPQNFGGARLTTVTIAGQAVVVNQASGCIYSINPQSANFNAGGGNSNVMVVAGSTCPWVATSNAPWITITSGATGIGNGFVQYSVAANTGGPSRSGTITIAGQTFTVSQSGTCTFALSQTALTFPAAGGSGTILVTTNDPQCSFNAVSNDSWIFIVSVSPGTGAVTFSVEQNPGTQRTGTINIAGQILTITQLANAANRRALFDFDGDGKSDISVFRPSTGAWYLLNSNTGFVGTQFGQSGDSIVPADFDGDGKTDLAVFRGGTWYIQRSQLGFTSIQFGLGSDIPMPADFDGDNKADPAVFRPSNGTWYLQRSQLGFTGIQFGQSGDKPLAADFDGDGRADIAVFRPSNGGWYIQQSTNGFRAEQFGISEDKPVAADYDADGKADLAVFRPSSGTWFLRQSQAGFTGIQFGQSGDLPTVADYDGDGRADIAVYRTNSWFINRSTQGFTGVQFGQSGDLPVPNAFAR